MRVGLAAIVEFEPQRLHCLARLMYISDEINFNATDVFDSATGKWSTAELSVARVGMRAVSVGTFAIFAGGYLPWKCGTL